jgi:hypothetical protein
VPLDHRGGVVHEPGKRQLPDLPGQVVQQLACAAQRTRPREAARRRRRAKGQARRYKIWQKSPCALQGASVANCVARAVRLGIHFASKASVWAITVKSRAARSTSPSPPGRGPR